MCLWCALEYTNVTSGFYKKGIFTGRVVNNFSRLALLQHFVLKHQYETVFALMNSCIQLYVILSIYTTISIGVFMYCKLHSQNFMYI